MSPKRELSSNPAIPAPPPRSYPSRYASGLLLVCRKCQRKLKGSDRHAHAANLKKSLKKLAGKNGVEPIHVIGVPCLKLCPKGAVTVCTQDDLTRTPPTLTLIRTRKDVAALYRSRTGPERAIPAQVIPGTSVEAVSSEIR